MLKRFFVLMLLVTTLGAVGACGKMAAPDHPEGSTFPRQYPM